MQRSSTAVLIAALMVLLLSSLAVVNGMFMDMHGKMFQAELLDDCSVYVYDRVLFVVEKEGWCHRKKSSMNADVVQDPETEITYVSILSFYVDDDNIVKMVSHDTNGKHWSVDLISQDYFEALVKQKYYNVRTHKSQPHVPSEYGRYYVERFHEVKKWYEIVYEACKYGKTTSKSYANFVEYIYDKERAAVDEYGECDSNTMVHYPLIINGLFVPSLSEVVVKVDPNRPNERKCTVDGHEFILHPIKQSILTCALAYDFIEDFSASFPLPYSTPVIGETNLRGPKKSANSITFNEKSYPRPRIENDYSEQPFFFYDPKDKTYSPLFLYYKFKGTDRRFTVRFIYENREGGDKFHDIFAPLEYMNQCRFPTGDPSLTVAAAPRVVKQNEELISIEVYFLINNVDFKFCVFDIEFRYGGAQYKVNLKLTSEINAYVHVEQRSTTAANCDHDRGTVRWLLAYSTNGYAELVSLDNSVSSPIFQCHHCGPDAVMYCDVSPEARRYHSAVYIQTIKDGNTKVTHVKVVNNRGYELKVEFDIETRSGEYYFFQSLDLKLEPHDIWVRIQEGKAKTALPLNPKKHPTTRQPEMTTTRKLKFTAKHTRVVPTTSTEALTTTYEPVDDDDDDEYGPDWLNAVNSYFNCWPVLFAFFYLSWNI